MSYPSDMSEKEWELVRHLEPEHNKMGRPRKYEFRQILNALFYVDRTGCQWRYLPESFPPWATVYYYSRKWSLDGTIQNIHNTLRQKVRHAHGKEAEPSAVSIDSQSVKTSQKGGPKI